MIVLVSFEMVDSVGMDWVGVDSIMCNVVSRMTDSERVRECCEEYFHFSSLLIIGGSCGIVLLLWVVLRFRDVLKQTYCGCLYKQNENLHPNLRSRLDSINYPAPRTSRSWSDVTGMTAVLSRVQAYRKDTPPPPYEAPPSYHVAIRIEMEEEGPPGYEESGTCIV